MKTVTTAVQNLIDAENITRTWRFIVTDTNDNVYYWSTEILAAQSGVYASDMPEISGGPIGDFNLSSYFHFDEELAFDYEFRLKDFEGIKLEGGSSSIVAPSGFECDVIINDAAFDPDDFDGGEVRVSEWLSKPGEDEECVRRFRFTIKDAGQIINGLSRFVFEDFFAAKRNGTYPNTPLVDSLFPSTNKPKEARSRNDLYCVPATFGTAYLPLRAIYYNPDAAIYYLLGAVSGTYTITEVQTPLSEGYSATYTSGSYSFTQATKSDGSTNWRVFQAIIAKSVSGGAVDSNAWWKNGRFVADLPTKFSNSETSGVKNPALVTREILKDMGVAAQYLDDVTFLQAYSVYDGWGLEYEGGHVWKQANDDVLAELLESCNSYLVYDEDIELHVRSKTSVKTIDSSDCNNFRYKKIKKDVVTAGYAGFYPTGESQETGNETTLIVPAKADSSQISGDLIVNRWVRDSQDVHRAAQLHYQREYLKKAEITFSNNGNLAACVPGDIITIDDSLYGGTYDVMIESMLIRNDGTIDVVAYRFSDSLDDWGDLAPGAVTVTTDALTGATLPVFSSALLGDPDSGIRPTRVVDPIELYDGGDLRFIAKPTPTFDFSDIQWCDSTGAIKARISGISTPSIAAFPETDKTGFFIIGYDEATNPASTNKRWDYIYSQCDQIYKAYCSDRFNSGASFNFENGIYFDQNDLYIFVNTFGGNNLQLLLDQSDGQFEFTGGDLTFDGNLIIADTKYIGLGAAKARIEFNDSTTDDFRFLSGRVMIGSDVAPDYELHIMRASAGSVASNANSLLTLENGVANNYIQFLSTKGTNYQGIYFGNPTDGNNAAIFRYLMSTATFDWYIGGSSRLSLSASAAFPTTDGGLSIGTGTNGFSDVFCQKVRMTAEGGLAIRLTNKTGGASIKGYIAEADTTTDDAFTYTTDGVPDPIGIVYEAGIADGSECWVVVAGIADVYYGGAVTRGTFSRVPVAADGAPYATGMAIAEAVPTSPFATDKHFQEIGHPIESIGSAGLARTVLHFN
jgi:hypothetical protein